MTPNASEHTQSAPAAGRAPRYPNAAQTQLWTLLTALRRGERLTVLVALDQYQCYALSQRIGQIKALGWHVQRRMVKVGSGKAVAEYSL